MTRRFASLSSHVRQRGWWGGAGWRRTGQWRAILLKIGKTGEHLLSAAGAKRLRTDDEYEQVGKP